MMDETLLDQIRVIADEEMDDEILNASYDILDAADNIPDSSDEVSKPEENQ